MTILKNYWAGCQIVFDLGCSVPFKTKRALKEQVINCGGVISYIVTKTVSTKSLVNKVTHSSFMLSNIYRKL